MPEQAKSISEARHSLPSLSQSAQLRRNRYIITHQGRPQSVLLGYKDYQSLKMAAELLHRPDLVESIKSGLGDLENGRRMSDDEVKRDVENRSLNPSNIAAPEPSGQKVRVADLQAEGKARQK